MNPSTLINPILASGGDHGYLYGLFFLILALIIGAAARHFLNKVPLPFTVVLMLIGLGLGFAFRTRWMCTCSRNHFGTRFTWRGRAS